MNQKPKVIRIQRSTKTSAVGAAQKCAATRRPAEFVSPLRGLRPFLRFTQGWRPGLPSQRASGAVAFWFTAI